MDGTPPNTANGKGKGNPGNGQGQAAIAVGGTGKDGMGKGNPGSDGHGQAAIAGGATGKGKKGKGKLVAVDGKGQRPSLSVDDLEWDGFVKVDVVRCPEIWVRSGTEVCCCIPADDEQKLKRRKWRSGALKST